MKKMKLNADYLTDDEVTCGVLIKKDSVVLIKGIESNGIAYAEYLDFGFSIPLSKLTPTP